MFRRIDSGLPKDPEYPTDLKGLGYFINEKDEIRNIEDPKAYFKYFLAKNERYNVKQRESMNEAIRNIVSERLEALDLEKIRLPLGASEDEPNLPIFISSDIAQKERIIILFYEHIQDLGIFAHRILGGPGGVNQGSAVNFVKHIQALSTSPSNPEAPGIILANLGQLRWWRRGRKAVTQTSWFALPQKSAVEPSYRYDPLKNTTPGNRSTEEHIDYIFNHVVEQLSAPQAKIDIVGVSEGAVRTVSFLDAKDNFNKWGKRVQAFAALAMYYDTSDMHNPEFKDWFTKRGRAYIVSTEPCNTFLCGPAGTRRLQAFGCPAFSIGEPYYSEAMLPFGYKTILDWFQEVTADAKYENPHFERLETEEEAEQQDHW